MRSGTCLSGLRNSRSNAAAFRIRSVHQQRRIQGCTSSLRSVCRCTNPKEGVPSKSGKDADEVTKKWGLEAGIFSALKNKDGSSVSAKELLKQYGAAYLLTSISLALMTFSFCYVAVDAGIDVPALLSRIGITVSSNSAGEKAGTVALAYAAHKALSPVRFPPTVALTPLVAQKLGKRKGAGDGAAAEGESD